MCGIFALVNRFKSLISDEQLKQYCDLIKHRGPDDSEYVNVDPNVFFGFHRLAIVDPTAKSNQPLNLGNCWLICNAEIFNHKTLEQQYQFEMKTGSDCEVILHLYEYYGGGHNAMKQVLNLIDAEFAGVLYDMDRQVCFAFRDHYGIRPLFWAYDKAYPQGYFFASELKALSFMENVEQFSPAHFVEIPISSDIDYTYKHVLHCYYQISLEKIWPEPSLKTIHWNINQLLRKSVERRLMSDRGVGCFLSGGVDSSLITALVSEHIPNLHCFTIGLNDEGVDIIAAKKVVAHLNANGRNITHHVVHFSIEEGFNALRDVIRHLESYDLTTIRASTPQYLLSKYIKENTDIVVLYSGEGADEIFASYLYNRFAPNSKELELDSKRLIEELYLYDNLRVDRTTSASSLEVRIPFLDKCLVNYIFALDPEHRMCNNKMEKLILRDSFKEDNLLPEEVLYRQKCAFSDSVSSQKLSWYKSLQELIAPLVSDEDLLNAKNKYPHVSPMSKEALYYRDIFNELFPNKDNVIDHFWMPKWIDTQDPSARVFSSLS